MQGSFFPYTCTYIQMCAKHFSRQVNDLKVNTNDLKNLGKSLMFLQKKARNNLIDGNRNLFFIMIDQMLNY